MLFYATAKLGEMLKAIPDFHGSGRGTMKKNPPRKHNQKRIQTFTNPTDKDLTAMPV